MFYRFKIHKSLYYGYVVETKPAKYNKNVMLYTGIFYKYIYKYGEYRRLAHTILYVNTYNEITKVSKQEFDNNCKKEIFELGEYASYRGKPLQVNCLERFVLINGDFIPSFKLKRITKEEYENFVISQL